MTQVIYGLYPLNDVALVVTLKEVNAAGKQVPLETGVVTGFLAITDDPTATEADPTLLATVAYTGAGGKWKVTLDAGLLTPGLLASLFASATPYLILQLNGGFRVAIEMAYFETRPAVQS